MEAGMQLVKNDIVNNIYKLLEDKKGFKEYFDYINEKKPLNVTIHFCEHTYEALENICTQIYWSSSDTVYNLAQAVAPAAQAEIDEVFYDMSED